MLDRGSCRLSALPCLLIVDHNSSLYVDSGDFVCLVDKYLWASVLYYTVKRSISKSLQVLQCYNNSFKINISGSSAKYSFLHMPARGIESTMWKDLQSAIEGIVKIHKSAILAA